MAYEAILVGHFLKNQNFQKSWNFKIQENTKNQMMNIKKILLDCKKSENCEIYEKEAKNVKIDARASQIVKFLGHFWVLRDKNTPTG